ncbi:MAG: Blt protein [Candidatus Magasanikbacteria bacterium GW2011_GWC2_37_14]|uniref:Blt protein n=1 Tax=Candidatus Magasanikbacteria bacterium GW2011_GWC2_37_14 TaxID=1619046 RepID=A0A0G0GLF9_9BACT|nr:MAG: Blt protein [Candidatus Magasanikbacteria bacterium GW2011_GWC2_37_14]
MPTIRHFLTHVKKYGNNHKIIYTLSLMMLFWCIYDGIITFITPIYIVQSGMSGTLMGIIVGTSSIAGALFDFIACRIFKNMFFRRVFLIMFGICLFYPLYLYEAKSFWAFIIGMAVWGVYYDLKNFGIFDIVGRFTKPAEHSSSFGVIQVFVNLGYLLSPIIAGFIVGEMVDWKPFFVSWIFLLVSGIFLIMLFFLTRQQKNSVPMACNENCKRINFLNEIHLWKKIGHLILPVLLLTLLLNLIDAFFWTVGPILAESFEGMHQFAGFFMTAYSLPTLLVGWFVGSITTKYGKKKTAMLSLLIGSLILSSLYFFQGPLQIIGVIFLASIFISLSWPAINGVYADYISETEKLENEINGLEDFFTNVGYVIGPMIAGILVDLIGNTLTFSVLGIFVAVCAFVLLLVTPKKIQIKV